MKIICKRLTASLIWNMAYGFSIMLTFPSILRNSRTEVSIKIQTMALVLNVFKYRFFVFYLLWHNNLPATEKKVQVSQTFFSVAGNEVKTCGLVQQLILHMLRDLILQSCNSHLLNGDPPLCVCVCVCLYIYICNSPLY